MSAFRLTGRIATRHHVQGSEAYTLGVSRVNDGKQSEFVEGWKGLATGWRTQGRAEDEVAGVTVSTGVFEQALRRVLPAVSRDRKHPELECVLIEAAAPSLRLVTTDRARMAVAEVPLSAGAEAESLRALVAGRDLEQLDLGETVNLTLRIDAGSLHVNTDHGTHTLPLVEADFPDYERLLAADPDPMTLVVSRDALVDAVEAQADDEPLRIHVGEDVLELGESPPVRLPTKYHGKAITLHLNPSFLHDAAESAAGPRLAIDVTGSRNPVVIRSIGDETHLAIVMPVRTREG